MEVIESRNWLPLTSEALPSTQHNTENKQPSCLFSWKPITAITGCLGKPLPSPLPPFILSHRGSNCRTSTVPHQVMTGSQGNSILLSQNGLPVLSKLVATRDIFPGGFPKFCVLKAVMLERVAPRTQSAPALEDKPQGSVLGAMCSLIWLHKICLPAGPRWTNVFRD